MVTVVMPVYDRTDLLMDSARSILAQTHKELELLIVSAVSPPSTMACISALLREDERVRLIPFSEQSGNACRGRNAGIVNASYPWVAFQDSDDLAAPDRIERSLDAALKNNADVVYGTWKILKQGEHDDRRITDGMVVECPDMDLDLLLKANLVCTGTVMAKTAALRQVGGFKPRMRWMEDWELWLRLAYCGFRFANVRKVLCEYRIHPGNLERQYKKDSEVWEALVRAEYHHVDRPLWEAAIA